METNFMKNLITIFLIIITFTFSVVCQEKIVIPIKVERNKTLITIKIGNVVIPDIILDTGYWYDGIMIYHPNYKDSLDLANAIETQMGGAGSGNASKALMIDSTMCGLGNLMLNNQRIILLQNDTFKGFPSNGIIGYSIFGHYVTEFDYDKNTMTLYDTNQIIIDSSWTDVPLYFKDNNIPWLDASVVIEKENPVTLSMYIDFAAGDPVLLLEKPEMKVSLPKQTESVYIGRGLSGDIYGKKGYISKLIIGKYELNNVTAFIAPAKVRSKQVGADAILGNGSLMRFNLIFDYNHKKLYLKPNTHFRELFK
jgi:hypothetical protein